MLIPILAALAAVTQPPAPETKAPPNSCTPPESCRFVPSFVLRDERAGTLEVKADTWTPFFEPDGKLVLAPGETMVIRLDKYGKGLKPRVVASGRAERLVKDDRDAASEAEALAHSGEEKVRTGTFPGGVAAVRADRGTIRITFEQALGRPDMMLKVDNGYGRTLDYRASILRVGAPDAAPTTICLVKPGTFSYESWPEPIVVIKLHDFAFVDDPGTVELKHCD